MFIYFVFFICIHLGIKVTSADPFDTCLEIFKPKNVELMCCENMMFGNEHWKGCDKKAGDDCFQPQCTFKKLGLITPANSMNETAIAAALSNLEKAMPNMKPITQRVQMYCLGEQYMDYDPSEDSCEPLKFLVCAYINSMVGCTTWKKTEVCMKLQHMTMECKSGIDGP